MELPSVSVVIVSRNRRADLTKAVESAKALDYPGERMELVVVEEAKAPLPLKGVNYVFIAQKRIPDFGYARNLGVKAAKNEIIAFTDDDCVVEKDWLKELAAPFEGKEIFGVAGAVKVKDTNAIGRCENILGFPGGGSLRIYKSKGKIAPTEQLSTCNCAFRKAAFDDVGYFKEQTPYSGEDYDFARRLSRKYKCLYNPNAIVYHKPRANLWRIFRWFNRRGICETFLLAMRTDGVLEHLWYNARASLLLRLLILAFVLNFFGLNKLHIWGMLAAFYYIVILGRYVYQLKIQEDLACFFLTPIVKFVMDSGMEFGRLIGPFVYIRYKRSLPASPAGRPASPSGGREGGA